jgi:hypothetical protein
MSQEPRLSRYIVADATPEELARQWHNVEARLGRRPRRRAWMPLTLALTGAVAIAFWLSHRGTREPTWTTQGAPAEVVLADGSHMALRPASRVRLTEHGPGQLGLRLEQGGARFEVRRDPRRQFRVSAGPIDVVVTGTIFGVAIADATAQARVVVEQGTVEVRRKADDRLLARLRAGESWSSARGMPPIATEPLLAPPSEGPPSHATSPEKSVPASSPSAAPSTPGPRPASATRTTAAPRPDAKRAVPGPAMPSEPAQDGRPTLSEPRALLEQANVARRKGDVKEAAALLETLRVRHPGDPRAALATFELGRLRMDALGDLPGAVAALQQSIALAPTGVFREDAEACLATAYARLRDGPRCERARETYLRHYPSGTHAAEVTALRCVER